MRKEALLSNNVSKNKNKIKKEYIQCVDEFKISSVRVITMSLPFKLNK